MITRSQTSDFELSLQENLALFCAPPPAGDSLFNSAREIAIARFALNCQAEAYYQAITLLSSILQSKLQELDDITSHNNNILSPNATPSSTAPQLLQSILQLISAIEIKSASLISASNNVTALLGKAVTIDVDKAALHSMLLNLPQLVNESISQITNDQQLAQQVSSHLSNRIESMLVAIRFEDQTNQATGAITVEQYTALIESVPQYGH